MGRTIEFRPLPQMTKFRNEETSSERKLIEDIALNKTTKGTAGEGKENPRIPKRSSQFSRDMKKASLGQS